MTLRSYNNNSKQDVTGALRLGIDILQRSSFVFELQARVDARKGKGRPSHLPQYTGLAVLGCLFQLMYANQPATISNVQRCLWFDYTPEQLEILGLPKDWRDETRAARIKRNLSVQNQEYSRLYRFYVDWLEPTDDTPFDARSNKTWGDVRAARVATADQLADKTVALHRAVNQIIAASVPIHLMGDYRGHLTIDLHNIGVVPVPQKNPVGDDTIKQGPPTAGFAIRHQRLGAAIAVALTCAVASYGPDDPPVPRVALGAGIGQPDAADAGTALIAIDAADLHPAMLTKLSNGIRYVITDMAYPWAVSFTARVLERRRYLISSFRKNQNHVYDLRARPDDTDGPRLVNGCVICPGIPAAVARSVHPAIHDSYDKMSPDDLLRAKDHFDYLESARMPTHGRPVPATRRGPGRPRKDQQAQTDEQSHRVEVFCPATRGKIRCPLVPESMSLPTRHRARPSENAVSWVCFNAKTSLHIPPIPFKNYSHLMVGTEDHHDLYKHARAHNEHFHSRLVSTDVANLNDRTLRQRRSSEIAMVIAIGVAIANIHVTDTYLDRRLDNGGVSPESNRSKIRRARAEQRKQH